MTGFSTRIAASLLSADFSAMDRAVKTAESAGADWLHLDVMDGAFVPNLTFGPKMVQDIRKLTKLPMDVHLMVERPQNLIPQFIDAGADHITFHLEAVVHTHRVLMSILQAGKKAGISIVPSTPASALAEILPVLDIILIMTVNPGFGGQKLIPSCLDKVSSLVREREEHGYRYLLAVDGGINRETVASVRKAGTDVIISGSAFYGSDTPSEEVRIFRGQAMV